MIDLKIKMDYKLESGGHQKVKKIESIQILLKLG